MQGGEQHGQEDEEQCGEGEDGGHRAWAEEWKLDHRGDLPEGETRNQDGGGG